MYFLLVNKIFIIHPKQYIEGTKYVCNSRDTIGIQEQFIEKAISLTKADKASEMSKASKNVRGFKKQCRCKDEDDSKFHAPHTSHTNSKKDDVESVMCKTISDAVWNNSSVQTRV